MAELSFVARQAIPSTLGRGTPAGLHFQAVRTLMRQDTTARCCGAAAGQPSC